VGSEPLRVLNVSGGVQSSTLVYMAARGELPVDVAIFADTRWEGRRTYDQVDRCERIARDAGIEFRRVGIGSLPERVLTQPKSKYVTLPAWTRAADGTEGKMREVCTYEYKIAPIRREVRRIMAERGARRVVQYLGFSLDEVRRVRPSDVGFIRLVHPLIERRMTRADCIRYAERHGFPVASQTSCLGCPLSDDGWFRYLRDESPEEWAEVVAFDRAIRRGGPRGVPFDGEVFLHRSRRPLDEVDLRTPEERGQERLFA